MLLRVPIVILLVLAGAQAQDPQQILKRAIERQGALPEGGVKELHLSFNGQVSQKDEEHHIRRHYWYRAADRSFRIKTQSRAARKESTDRGVFGKDFWECGAKGGVVHLSKANLNHRKVIQSIRKDRSEFERIMNMVLLSRLKDAKLTMARKNPVKILKDHPFEENHILGADRNAHSYWVIDVERKDRPRMRVYVHSRDFKVCKAVQFDVDEPGRPIYWYYFGPYFKRPDGLTLPRYFTVHTSVPRDEKTRRATAFARGEIQLKINDGSADTALKPASACKG